MSCQSVQDLIHQYIDGEVDILRGVDVERHLDRCEDCYQAYGNQISKRSSLRYAALYYRAPQALKERISASLRRGVQT